MWLARFSGHADALQHQRVDLLVEHRRAGRRRAPRPARHARSAGTAAPGCRARLVRNVAVEYRLLATNATATQDDYGACAAGRGIQPPRRSPVRRAEPDRGQQREHDDEIGQVAQCLRQFERGEPRRAHQVDRHLAGHRVADGHQPHRADALACGSTTPPRTAASATQPSTITVSGGVAHGDAGAQRCQSHGPPTRPGTMPWVTERLNRSHVIARSKLQRFWSTTTRYTHDPRRGQRQRRRPTAEFRGATPSSARTDRP